MLIFANQSFLVAIVMIMRQQEQSDLITAVLNVASELDSNLKKVSQELEQIIKVSHTVGRINFQFLKRERIISKFQRKHSSRQVSLTSLVVTDSEKSKGQKSVTRYIYLLDRLWSQVRESVVS